MDYSFVIPIAPVTKKNSQQIFMPKNGRVRIAPSKAYIQYLDDVSKIIHRIKGIPKSIINHKINLKALYFMKTERKVDLINLHSALHDVLVACNILVDDNCTIIVSTDGSMVHYDKKNPRTEVTITKIEELKHDNI
jgi:Holliday junction resolvase RusA-like endonuclease